MSVKMNYTSNREIRSSAADPFNPTIVQGVPFNAHHAQIIYQSLPGERRSSAIAAAVYFPARWEYAHQLVRKFKQAFLTIKQTLVHINS